MSPLPGTVEAIVLIVFSGGNTRCSSPASDELVEITVDRASNAQAGPRAFIVSVFMIVPLVAIRGRAAPAVDRHRYVAGNARAVLRPTEVGVPPAGSAARSRA